jgi:hypothetical protein
MAGRHLTQFMYSLERMPVKLYAVATGAGAADMTLQYWNPTTGALATVPTGGAKGIKSITYLASAGKFRITLQDAYQRLLGLNIATLAVDGATQPVAPNWQVFAQAVTTATGGTIDLWFYAPAGTVLTSPTSNSRLYIEITLSNSTAF